MLRYYIFKLMKKSWKNQQVFPHTTKIYTQSWTLIVSAPYRNYLECQRMYYALFVTVSSLIEITDILVSSSQPILMRYFKPRSIVLKEFHFLWKSLLREKYWIPSARQVVRSILRRCVTCCRVIGKPYSREPPPLSSMQTRQCKPFEVTRVDFTGALHL